MRKIIYLIKHFFIKQKTVYPSTNKYKKLLKKALINTKTNNLICSLRNYNYISQTKKQEDEKRITKQSHPARSASRTKN